MTTPEAIADALTCFGCDAGLREQEARLAVLRLLADGDPVELDQITARTGLGRGELTDLLKRSGRVRMDAAGRVVAFRGLSIIAAPHSFRIAARELYTWCAWDTLFLSELIGEPANVESRCPATSATISLRVGPQGPSDLDPLETMLSFRVPGTEVAGDPIASFCRYVHFFASAAAAEEWASQHPGVFVISVEQGFEVGKLTNARDFGDALVS